MRLSGLAYYGFDSNAIRQARRLFDEILWFSFSICVCIIPFPGQRLDVVSESGTSTRLTRLKTGSNAVLKRSLLW